MAIQINYLLLDPVILGCKFVCDMHSMRRIDLIMNWFFGKASFPFQFISAHPDKYLPFKKDCNEFSAAFNAFYHERGSFTIKNNSWMKLQSVWAYTFTALKTEYRWSIFLVTQNPSSKTHQIKIKPALNYTANMSTRAWTCNAVAVVFFRHMKQHY